MAVIPRLHRDFALLVNSACVVQATLRNTGVRDRVLADYRLDPQSVNLCLLLPVVDSLAFEGRVDEVDDLLNGIERSWPEVSQISPVKRAAARYYSTRFNDTIQLLRPSIEKGDACPEAFLLTALAYGKLGQLREQRQVLHTASGRFLGLRDICDHLYAGSLLQDQGAEAALAYLDSSEAARSLGPYGKLTRADLLIITNRKDDALDILDQLIHTEDVTTLPTPGQIGAWQRFAHLLCERGEDQRAREAIARMLDLFPDYPDAIMVAAGMYAMSSDESALRDLVQKAHGQSPDLRLAVLGMLAVLIASRKNSVEQLLTDLRTHADRIELVMAIDVKLTETERLKDAPSVFLTVEEIAPGLAAEWMELRRKAIASGGRRQLDTLREGLTKHPENLMFRFAMADVLESLGELDEAMSVIDQFAVTSPENAAIVSGWKARAYTRAGKLDEARRILDPFLDEAAPLPVEVVGAASGFLEKSGDLDEQIRFHRRVARLHPSLRASAANSIICLLLENAKNAEALSEIQSLAAEGALPVQVKLSQTDALQNLERYDEAQKVIDEIDKTAGVSGIVRSIVRCDSGDICRRREQWDKAAEFYREALKYDSDSVRARLGLAEALERLGEPAPAYETLMDAVALKPFLAGEFSDMLQRLRARSRTSS